MAEPVSVAAALGWAMSAAGWVVSPLASQVLKDAYTMLKIDSSQTFSLLSVKIAELQDVFGRGESELFHHKVLFEPLMENLRSAMYEAEDFLNDLSYHRTKAQIQELTHEKSNMAHNFQKLVKEKLNAKSKDEPPGLSKKKLKKVLTKIESIVNEAHRILQSTSLQKLSNDYMPSVTKPTGIANSKIIGREIECDSIVAMLHAPEKCENSCSYSVIGIYGMAGSGKTTLAQAVYAREKETDYFDICIWLYVSEDFEPEKVIREMIEEIPEEVSQGQSSENILIDKLKEKRFLLVLDDLWCRSADAKSCEKVQQILPPRKAGKKGSKVLITSRLADAALVLGAEKHNCIPISDLNESTFHELFLHYAFGGICSDDKDSDDKDLAEFQQLAVSIGGKLKRSPLLAKTVGVQLNFRKSLDFWRKTERCEILKDTLGALWWGYQQLQQPVRRCFAFCAIFPRGRRLYRNQIVRLWVAGGLVSGTQADMESSGNDYFDELVSSSFLQSQGVDIWNGEYFLVHDLMYELAVRVSGTDLFKIEKGCKRDIPKNTRHLYVESDDVDMLKQIPLLQNLRTLIIENPKLDLESMLKHPKLWILIAPFNALVRPYRAILPNSVINVPEYVCGLKYLRYFSLVGQTSAKELHLPSKFARLYQLQVLDIGHCKTVVSGSGKEKVIFTNLRHVVSSGRGLICLPNIGSCSSLHTLSHFEVKNEESFRINELQGLNNLHGTLHISGLEHIRSPKEALEANLSCKIHIRTLCLKWGTRETEQPDIESQILESLCPSPYLEKLYLGGYHGSTYPQWLVGEQTVTKHLRQLYMYYSTQDGPAPELSVLTNLEQLILNSVSWNALPSSLHSLTKLKKLYIISCANIQELPILPISLDMLIIHGGNDLFLKSCATIGHPNWEKILHIPRKMIIASSQSVLLFSLCCL